MDFGSESLEEMIRMGDISPDTVLYMDMGETELGWHDTGKNFWRFSTLLAERGVRLTARIVPDGTHSEASWQKQIPFFLETLLYELEE